MKLLTRERRLFWDYFMFDLFMFVLISDMTYSDALLTHRFLVHRQVQLEQPMSQVMNASRMKKVKYLFFEFIK